ncbi:MAG TPA: serine hydrolase domain-containing protein [Anaerolineae bacterium]|nr:serine hydrolase domain-containing protein [Anaerolineae bacterium]
MILAALLAGPAAAVAADVAPPKADVDLAAADSYVEAQMQKHGLRGVSLAIIEGDEVLYLKGYGSAGKGQPMTPQTPMFIGSQSKSFTALAIAQLAEQGLVDVEAPVRDYIPWFAVADEDASVKIKVSHLLHHTSGLSDAGFAAILAEDTSIEDAVRALATARLTAPVGVKHQYFNIGYDVLAYIVETVSGQSYAEYVQEQIFDPLQMTQSYADPELAAQNGLSQGYTRFFGFPVAVRQPTPTYELAAGYLISSAEDMARYAIAMSNDGVYAGTRVLSTEWMRQLFRPVQGYGMGWMVGTDHVYHGGANETFKTFVDLYPRRDLGIVLLINQGYMVDHFVSAEQLFDGIEALVLGSGSPDASVGWSTRVIGWLLLVFVVALAALHAWNIYRLKGWRERARGWSPVKRAWDVVISFIIPTVILIVVFSQVKAFWGDRFNLTYQMLTMTRTLPDVTILMLVGTIPDYAQGVTKLVWALKGRK